MSRNTLKLLLFMATLGTATGILVACGGGSSSMSGTSTPASASGTVTGFGSVIVNGTEFATGSGTQVVDGDSDDAPSTSASVRVGMSVDLDSDNGTATFLRFTSAVRGEIDAIDTTGNTITVLGQTVNITSGTSYAGSKTSGGTTTPVTQLSNLAVGDYVIVYGYLECASGGCSTGSTDVVATLVVEPPAAGMYRVQGYVQNFNASAGSFTIGGLTVDFTTTGTMPTNCIPAGCGFANGDFVSARSMTAPTGTAGSTSSPLTLAATDIHKKSEAPAFVAGTTVTIEGPVQQLSGTGFIVRGVVVDASASSLATTVGALANNQVVEVTGTISSSGTLVATAITVERFATFALMGPLDAAPGTTFSVLGQTFTVNSSTRFDDEAQDVRPFNASNFASVLMAGDQLIVAGYPSGGMNVATRVERIHTPATPTAAVAGIVTADDATADTVTAAGIKVSVSSTTHLFYSGAMMPPTLAGFFAAITPNSTLIAARGAPGSMTATINATDAALMRPGTRWDD